MTFCDYLRAAWDSAPGEEAKAAVQALIDKYCGSNTGPTTGSGGDGPPPTKPK